MMLELKCEICPRKKMFEYFLCNYFFSRVQAWKNEKSEKLATSVDLMYAV